ncbi:MAG: hypothetical protein JWQ42_3936 [Edaphobacter sp.]|nr:hypothetical protein [Edaphobacter sp.]
MLRSCLHTLISSKTKEIAVTIWFAYLGRLSEATVTGAYADLYGDS